MRINRKEGRLSLEGPKPVNINIKPRQSAGKRGKKDGRNPDVVKRQQSLT